MLRVTFLHLCTHLVVWRQMPLCLLEQHPLASAIVLKRQANRLRRPLSGNISILHSIKLKRFKRQKELTDEVGTSVLGPPIPQVPCKGEISCNATHCRETIKVFTISSKEEVSKICWTNIYTKSA